MMHKPTYALLLTLMAGSCAPSSTPDAPLEPCADPIVAPTVLHRLNHTEYDRSVQDLLAVDLAPATDFPADEQGSGFDNISSVQQMSTLWVEKYSAAAELLAQAALQPEEGPFLYEIESFDLAYGQAGILADGSAETWWLVDTDTRLPLPIPFSYGGTYELLLTAQWTAGREYQAVAPQIDLDIDHHYEGTRQFASFTETETFSFTVFVSPGEREIGLTIKGVRPAEYDEMGTRFAVNIGLDVLEVIGPAEQQDIWDSDARHKLLVCDPDIDGIDPCAREIATTLAERAWRRPITPDETDQLASLVSVALDYGDDFETGVQLMVEAVLLSPNFLYLVEDATGAQDPTGKPLDAYELATRLSYFLWSSLPDDELLQCAESDEFESGHGPCDLEVQVERMLGDPRAEQALIDDFAAQWLQLRALDTVQPDPNLFPTFNDQLAASMRRETDLVLAEFFHTDADLRDLVDLPWTRVDANLERHYGLDAGRSGPFRRIPLDEIERRGILGHAGVLTLTSHPTRTSPVQRGLFVLSRLLCDPPPPAPDDIPPIESEPTQDSFAQHASDPACTSCHSIIDPIGFGLNQYDAIGRYRTEIEGDPIDTSGVLPDGTAFSTSGELVTLLREDLRLGSCITELLYTWAMARTANAEDTCALQEITDQTDGVLSFARLARAIATSHPMRRLRVVEDP